MNNSTKEVLLIAKYTFICSLVIGTLIILLFLINKYTPIVLAEEVIIYIGILYTLIAILVNLIVFLNLIIVWINTKGNGLDLFKHCILLLANIPIAIFYLFLVISK